MAMAMAGAGKHIMTWEIITGAGFKLRGTLVIGENWGAKLKLGGYEEHWQAQAMAMSVDIIGIGATLGNALTRVGNIFGSLLITGAVLELRGELGNIGTGLGQHWVSLTMSRC